MPKKIFQPVDLPPTQPDCCDDCPLLGLIPKEMRSTDPKDKFKSLVCIATSKAITRKASVKKASLCDSHHPLHRHCDKFWDAWMLLPGRKYNVTIKAYNTFRIPLIQERNEQLIIDFG